MGIRQARIDLPGLLYHVMLRGIERREIFVWKEDKEDFIKRLVKELGMSSSGISKLYRRGEEAIKTNPKIIECIIST